MSLIGLGCLLYATSEFLGTGNNPMYIYACLFFPGHTNIHESIHTDFVCVKGRMCTCISV